jgi:hypothetical protein
MSTTTTGSTSASSTVACPTSPTNRRRPLNLTDR